MQSAADQAAAEAAIKQCESDLFCAQMQTVHDDETRRWIDKARANLHAARKRHEPTVLRDLEWHKKMRASYAAKGDDWGVEQHDAGIAECERALADLSASVWRAA